MTDQRSETADPTEPLGKIRTQLATTKRYADQHNEVGSLVRCRELSLAITKIEEAVHWIDAAFIAVKEATRK